MELNVCCCCCVCAGGGEGDAPARAGRALCLRHQTRSSVGMRVISNTHRATDSATTVVLLLLSLGFGVAPVRATRPSAAMPDDRWPVVRQRHENDADSLRVATPVATITNLLVVTSPQGDGVEEAPTPQDKDEGSAGRALSEPLTCLGNHFDCPAPPPSPPSPPAPPLPPVIPGGSLRVRSVDMLKRALTAVSVGHILLAPGEYSLTAQLSITRAVIIEAEVPGSVRINAHGKVSAQRRVLYIDPPSADDVVEIIGLGITGGHLNNDIGGYGAGIWIHNGLVIMSALEIYGNFAFKGAGIYIDGGSSSIDSCDIHTNVADNGVGAGVCIAGGSVAFYSCDIHENVVTGSDGGGAGVAVTSERSSTFNACNIYDNHATGGGMYGGWSGGVGGGIAFRGGTTYLSNSTAIFNNTAFGGAANLYPASGSIYYLLPAPPGHWLPNGQCRVYREPCDLGPSYVCQASLDACSFAADNGTSTALVPASNCTGQYSSYCSGVVQCTPRTFVQPCDWQEHPELLGKRIYALPLGINVDGPFPHPCAAGVLGSTKPSLQNSAQCAGPCPAGFTCPTVSTVDPNPCDPGHYCPEGSSLAMPCKEGTHSNATGMSSPHDCMPTLAGYYSPPGSISPQPCGGSSLYCPGHEGKPRSIIGVLETYTDRSLNSALDPTNPLTRTSFSDCPGKHYCDSGQATICPFGHWCSSGEQHTCSAGLLGNATGLNSSSCNGPCPVAHYCPKASASALACRDGTVGNATRLRNASECQACPAGYWCNSGNAFPCPKGFFTVTNAPSDDRQSLNACQECPLHSTTYQQASTTADMCVCGATYFLDSTSPNATCIKCPPGTNCENSGTTIESLPVWHTYWKPGFLSVMPKPCPYASICSNGSMPSPYYNATSDATCTPGLGVAGVYCLLCAEASHYFDEHRERCNPCTEEIGRVVLFLIGIVLLIATIFAIARFQLVARSNVVVRMTWHNLVVSADQMSAVTKAKLVVSYYQIITQINRVYAIVPPPVYARVVNSLNAVFHVFFSWIPGVTTACMGLGLAHELLLICLVPIAIAFAAFIVTAARKKPLLSALPFVLVTAFLCFPFVASRGFRALAPCDCFSYTDGNFSCFLHDAYSIECIADGSGSGMAPDDVRMAAWLAIFIYAVFVPSAYVSLLLVSWRSLSGHERPTNLSCALRFLTKDYKLEAFAWELVEVARKITITGFLALVKPGSLIQLFLGVSVALCILILQLHATPYVRADDNFLSMVSASALVLTLLSSLGIQLTELTPELSQVGVQQTGLTGNAIIWIEAVLTISALLVFVIGFGMFTSQFNVSRKRPVARWARGQARDATVAPVATPRFLPRNAYHAFISHQWGRGQDQARAIKSQLSMLVPGLRIFLDIDDLTSIGKLEAFIDATDVIIVFLAGSTVNGIERCDYMRSANCIRELRRAVETNKRIVFVKETDPQHGSISMETHRRDCPEDLRRTLDENLIVPWYRVKAYAYVSLRHIAQAVLNGDLLIPGDLLCTSVCLASLAPGTFHLYAPAPAAEVAALLRAEVPGLMITTNPEERHRAQRYLLYLNGATWSADDLPAEMEVVLASEIPLLLVHEQRDGRNAISFDTIISHTPPELLSQDIYASLAVPLYDGDEYQRVCLRMMIHDPDATTQQQRLQKRRWWPTWRPLMKNINIDGEPALLEMNERRVCNEAEPISTNV